MMNISGEYKKVGWVIIGFCWVGVLYYTRPEPYSCDRIAEKIKTTFACNMVLNRIENNTGVAEIYGTDLVTNRDTVIEEYEKWIITNQSKFAPGDTIRKEKGEYTIYVKRKGKAFTIPFECDGVDPDTPALGK